MLRRHLGLARTVRVVLRYAGRSASADSPTLWSAEGRSAEAERALRHRLRSVVLLDEILASDLELPLVERLPILRDLVVESGTRFIETNASAQLSQWFEASSRHVHLAALFEATERTRR